MHDIRWMTVYSYKLPYWSHTEFINKICYIAVCPNSSSGSGSILVDNALQCRILSSNYVPGDSQLRSLGGGGLRGGGGIVVVEALRDYLCWIWSPFWSVGPKAQTEIMSLVVRLCWLVLGPHCVIIDCAWCVVPRPQLSQPLSPRSMWLPPKSLSPHDSWKVPQVRNFNLTVFLAEMSEYDLPRWEHL